MIGKEFDITRRRVLVTIVVIGLASLAAGAGTMAYFSDTETGNNNNVTAGTLDLTIAGGNSNVELLSVTHAKPGDSNSNSTTLANQGSVNGTLSVKLDVTSGENGVNDPESDSSTEQSGVVELNESGMNVTVALDANQNGAIDSGEWNLTNKKPAQLQGTYPDVSTLLASEQTDLLVRYEIPTDSGNEIQTDSVSIDATITLEQS